MTGGTSVQKAIGELADIPVLDSGGELIGLLRDVYFDDQRWRVRYLVVDAGAWLGRRRLLVPAAALVPNRVSYGAVKVRAARAELAMELGGNHYDVHSAAALTGYRIEAVDGRIGRVAEVVVQDDEWSIGGIIVDTRDLLPGHNVYLARALIERIDFANRRVHVRLTREQVKRSPSTR